MIGLILCVSNKYVHFPSDKCRKGHTSTATGHAPNFHKVYQLEKEIRPNCSPPPLSRKKMFSVSLLYESSTLILIRS